MSLRVSAVADRVTPPAPHADHRFATLPYTSPSGDTGVWVLSSTALPLRLTVQSDVVDRFGLETLRAAVTVWNGAPGSTFAANLTHLSEGDVHERARDGVSRIFLDRVDCSERPYLARAHMYPAEVESRAGRTVAWVDEVDIGICDRLTPDRLHSVIRHELGHVAGLGHLCDAGSDCYSPAFDPDNRCRTMHPAAYGCQEIAAGDLAGLAYLHPRLPRISGVDRTGTAAAVSYLLHPVPRSANDVIITAADAPPLLQAAATVLSGVMRWPHLLVDERCTAGPDGDELNRIATVGARVHLVGDVPRACEDDLRFGWELETVRLRDLEAVNERLVENTTPERVVIVDGAGPDDAVPDAALAVPVAAALGAPILPVTTDGEVRGLRHALDRAPTVTGAVLVGDATSISEEVTRRLEEEHGLRIRRLDATDQLDAVQRLSRMRDVYGHEPVTAVVVGDDRPDDALAAATLAANLPGGIVVPAGPDLDPRVLDLLVDRVERGYVIGGERAMPLDLHLRLSRAASRSR